MADPDILNQREAAEYLRISTRTLRDLQYRGEVKFSKVGARVVYRREWLDRYLDRQAIGGR